MMDEASAKVAMFRVCASAILEMNLSPEEARVAAQALRQGDVCSRLAMLLDGLVPVSMDIASAPKAENKQPARTGSSVKIKAKTTRSDRSPDALFYDVKRRKITKNQLFSLFSQVNRSALDFIDQELSMREALVKFRDYTPSDDWDLLADIIQGSGGGDPYLARITSGYA